MRKKEPIRVLQCVSYMHRAGIETMIMNFYRNIDRNKIQFDFLVNKNVIGDYDEEIKRLGGKIYVTPGLNPFKWFKYQKYMKNFFKEHPEYKIIHCQNEAMGFPALYAAKKSGVPVRIAHSHNTKTRLDFKWPIKILYKYLLRLVATDFVACSHAAGKYLFGKDVKVINNAIDTTKFTYNEELRNKLRKKMKLENKFVIGHVGRFEPQKNHNFLIDVFNNYNKINKESVLLLVGEGSLKEKIETKVNKLGLKDKVIFTGSIPNVNEIYQVMDLFLLPSFHEGLPVVGIEAQYSGLPCLLSKKITKETAISNLCKFLDINTIDHWVNEISIICEKRIDRLSIIDDDKYDINKSVINLKNYYIKLLEVRNEI